jgi:hypothetical protein
LKLNIHGIIQSKANGVNLLSKVRKPVIEAFMIQGTNFFIILIPR